jgi:aryl-alcohol dehydrogenase-like predicted oxidoreductase
VPTAIAWITEVALPARAWRMRDACASHGVPLPAAALQFTLRHPAVTAAVVGARTATEVTADVSYLSTPVPHALWKRRYMIAKTLVPQGVLNPS